MKNNLSLIEHRSKARLNNQYFTCHILYEPVCDKTNRMIFASSEESDQPEHLSNHITAGLQIRVRTGKLFFLIPQPKHMLCF